ncbi:four helix bundle protein [Candidatus Daviesbacteria bacterium RIFCSPLOWO2_02_FULL_38_18]|nr:MAG: four helix bundle protein [Candidatus Daviesbacteria bacterium RIFCSPHIGHO2_12_FULL_38_25]OGE68000.1 MAG: four helix bundle protein [Candidatus Daviesbacteria bacterium RIFCSPLOWO2_02_FULL_38_18]OGE73030.1 MAG: four helix bundle protein [Candidatus Daviesbacteria bacterium RIFCSPLOWO2_12_FULL_38_10]HCB22339.1 four helix bundle protein [Candidatus Daviesbacteria bacterium]
MTNEQNDKKFDLEERTAKFGEDVIKFCQKMPRGPITDPLITQLVKCGTSVGANYSEADDAESKADFKHKIGICKKEAREAKHFIKMIAVAVPALKEEAKPLWQEAKELNLIFNSIYRKVK